MNQDNFSGKVFHFIFLKGTNHMKVGKAVLHQAVFSHHFIFFPDFLHFILSEIVNTVRVGFLQCGIRLGLGYAEQ